MRKMKRGVAAIMALLLMVPAQPVMAGTQPPSKILESAATAGGEKEKKATPGNAEREENQKEETVSKSEGTSEETVEKVMKSKAYATSANARKSTAAKEEVKYNTGKHTYSVVSEEDFYDRELGDAYFEEDGSYTINIPELNPFFPYEVEFTYHGKTERKWFMTPDDSVEAGGHTFYVSADFDGNEVTQMSLSVGGDIVTVYPKEKEFTDEETEGAEPMSLLPLERKDLTVDLRGYTPVELTMVSISEIFTGDEMADGDKVMWSRYNDDYTINSFGDKLDLSCDTYSSSNVSWEMIVGDDDQLAADNVRYWVNVQVTPSEEWLIPTVYIQDSEGKRIKKDLVEKHYNNGYYDYSHNARYLDITASYEKSDYDKPVYIHLDINDTLFPEVKYDHLKLYEGKFTSAEEAIAGTEITNEMFNADMTQKDAGYLIKDEDKNMITIVAFDAAGNVVGCLPFEINFFTVESDEDNYNTDNHISCNRMHAGYGDYEKRVVDTNENEFRDGVYYYTQTLYKEYAVNQEYYLTMSYHKGNSESSFAVIAAYVGRYSSIEEAVAAGATDIKKELFSYPGYGADYSKGVFFTIFAGEDGVNAKETYYYMISAEAGLNSYFSPDSSAWVYFYGLKDSEGNYINADVINADDYGDGAYLTMLVDENVDLSRVAPTFDQPSTSKVYVTGMTTPEISGKSIHDFSKGPIQYTVAAQDGSGFRNLWLQIVKAGVGNGGLYINSLADEAAKTKVENGVTYSTREMFIDGRYGYQHDIVLINLGADAVPEISVDLVSDEVELDKYWTLKGNYALPDMDNDGKEEDGDIWNLAKIRILPKEDAEDGRDIKGTLTIKSGDKELIVLTLTGTVGDPSITTKEIPEAVKYVPYGTMIQNNNKYDWNRVSYRLVEGELPEGMEMRENGELYGVPAETGDFTFTVRMKNSYTSFSSSRRTFTLTVIENTDDNVDNATDEGYTLTRRVQSMAENNIYSQTLVSEGIYNEFVDIFLDGEKLEKDVDYTSEAGSTRITIQAETLKKKNTTGRHTLGIEFRTGEQKTLKRAAQNYEIRTRSSSSSGGSSGGGGGGGSRSSSKASNTSSIPRDAKKGYYNEQAGIITGEGNGYSHWVKDENGWRLNYADGTFAGGYVTQLADGTAAEQILWEKINGLWYAFGITGYLKSGWAFDYQLNGWYCLTEDFGMYSGWYGDAQDNCVYYLEPVTGKLAAGWKNIDDKWYYFNNEVSSIPTWNFNAVTGQWVYNTLNTSKPYGAMYCNEYTPDGYFVGADGVWDGQSR